MKKKSVILIALGLFIVFNIFNIYTTFSFMNSHFRDYRVTGHSLSGTLMLFIEGGKSFAIIMPQNTTYNFSWGDNLILELNVSPEVEFNNWWYTLEDLKHNLIIDEEIPFTPDITFPVVRWTNRLTVFANNSGGVANKSVEFFIALPDLSPTFEYIDSEIFVCENNYLSYFFNVTNYDERSLTPDISPKNPFYIATSQQLSANNTRFEIFSGTLDKNKAIAGENNWKTYEEIVSVDDGEFVDSADVNITVIAIDNAPIIDTIGVQTLWNRGVNSTFSNQVNVSDLEDGDQYSGNFSFNLSFDSGDKFFDINQSGYMGFVANTSLLGTYNITVCVNDSGVRNPHPNISLCGQDGRTASSCSSFSITLTDENRPPTILSYYPLNSSFGAAEGEALYFNISTYDPDGTTPDARWYVDDVLVEYDTGSLVNTFYYYFSYTAAETYEGIHNVTIMITDGVETDSIIWTVNVSNTEIIVSAPSGGGGGGGGGAGCVKKIACEDWGICMNAKKSLKLGSLFLQTYDIILQNCDLTGLTEETCGFRLRNCSDVQYCNNTKVNTLEPPEIESCQYIAKPSCTDGIENCHDGRCEIIADCGGPCLPCVTCSDGIKNQGEERIDCGGPCPACYTEKPLSLPPINFKKYLIILSIILIAILLAITLIVYFIKRIMGLYSLKKRISEFSIIK